MRAVEPSAFVDAWLACQAHFREGWVPVRELAHVLEVPAEDLVLWCRANTANVRIEMTGETPATAQVRMEMDWRAFVRTGAAVALAGVALAALVVLLALLG